MDTRTPKEIVAELDRYIVGQKQAKRSVAIALRNRWRRRQVPKPLRDEIYPKNIIMIGPTGVGKTEIARRLAKLANAPFIKVEATKYTEIGYVGKDVESMIRDLTEISVNMVKAEESKKVQRRAEKIAEDRVLDLLLPKKNKPRSRSDVRGTPPEFSLADDRSHVAKALMADDSGITEMEMDTREKFREMLRRGELDDRTVEIEVKEGAFPTIEIFTAHGMEEMDFNIKEAFGNLFPRRSKRRRVKVRDAMEIIAKEEANRLVDMDKVKKEAVTRTEQLGIVFLDEIDKIAGRFDGSKGGGPSVSREGVQRDILPVVEGSSVTTKYGVVNTDHVLFIASGAFNVTKPSDLIPELQGRFPIRVELEPLKAEDFVRILNEPENSLTRQYIAMMKSEGIDIIFEEGSVDEIARIAADANDRMENIGARRLNTVMERLFDEVSYEASDLKGQTIQITPQYVRERLDDLVNDEDLSRYIL